MLGVAYLEGRRQAPTRCGPPGRLLATTLRQMALGSGLTRLGGYPFEVRYSDGALVRARAAADVAADAYVYFSRLFAAVEPDIAVIVADEADWPGVNNPYGMAFFRADARDIR